MSTRIVHEIEPFDEARFLQVCADLGVVLADSDLQAQVEAAREALTEAQARPMPVWGLDGLVDAFEPTPVCENV